jgi:hypothetical protein
LRACVEGQLAAPPADPAPGQCWIIAPAATGAWAGKDGAIAGWTESGWRFIEPMVGFSVHEKNSGLCL